MTDAAVAVTERAVDEFATDYLSSLGATIHKDGRRWTVSLPDEVTTELSLDNTVVHIVADAEEADDDAVPLAPGSDLFERLIDDAAKRTPQGAITLTGDDIEVDTPDWTASDSVEVTDTQFVPYYDRKALCVLFHVGIETVSEYQRELLRAVAIDFADHELRPRLAETLLDLSERNGLPRSETSPTPKKSDLTETVDVCREMVEAAISPDVQDIRNKATRAAAAEIEEQRRYLQQRRDELEGEVQRLEDRVSELSATIDSASGRAERLEGLRKRKDVRNELTELQNELEEVRDDLDRDLPEKQATIRGRHALTVRIRPVTATLVEYERGDVNISVRNSHHSTTLTCDYAVGIGVLNQLNCEQCGTALNAQNPIVLSDTMYIGGRCCDKIN